MGLVRGCRGSRASEKGAVGVGLVRGCRGSREDAGHPLIALRVFHVGAPVMQRALFSDKRCCAWVHFKQLFWGLLSICS